LKTYVPGGGLLAALIQLSLVQYVLRQAGLRRHYAISRHNSSRNEVLAKTCFANSLEIAAHLQRRAEAFSGNLSFDMFADFRRPANI